MQQDHAALMMKSHFGGPKVVEQFTEKIKYSKNFSASTLLIPASGKPVGVLRGRITRECSHGPERNKHNKKVTLANQEKKFKVSHA